MKKNKNISPKKWCLGVLVINFIILACMATFTYAYDPFCYYRIPKDHIIVNNYRFVNPGIAKNAVYDTVIIGSSMTQNFVMDSFREKLNLNPIKLSVGGMSLEGTELTYTQVCDIGKANNIFICIDLPSLNKPEDGLSTYATYLYDDNQLNDYKYLLGYETWMRLMPLNLAFDFLDKNNYDIPNFYATEDLDTIGEWHLDVTYGEEILKRNYINSSSNVSSQNLDLIHKRMISNSDKLLDDIMTASKDKNIYFFFPPYSALYWYEANKKGYMGEFQEIKSYIVSELEVFENVQIYDFQNMEEILDLDNYKDTTHYSQSINELMVDYMGDEKFLVNKRNIDESILKLNEKVSRFEKDNNEWLDR